MKKFFPSCINVEGRSCWVIGNDREALEKTERLAFSGARVTIVAPQFSSEQKESFKKWGVTVFERPFDLGDLTDQFFVIFSDRHNVSLAQKIFEICRQKRILLCAIDQPAFCDVVNVSVFKKGRLSIMISTEGAAPGLSRKIRQGLEKSFESVPIEEFLDELAELRQRLEKEEPDGNKRREKLLAAVQEVDFSAQIKFPLSSERGK